MDSIRISLVQTDIVWEDKLNNLRSLQEKLQALRGETEIVVLPEMFATGFCMKQPQLAEPADGPTLTTLKQWATSYQMALCGSLMVEEGGQRFNRAFFLTPEGDAWFYDKRHLFRMGEESRWLAPGQERLILSYRGWNLCLLVCYDLRFPVWSRNRNNAYDLLIYVANWPAARQTAWDTLLRARAIENQCYVCGVNRVGIDPEGLHYEGGSVLVSDFGDTLASFAPDEAGVRTVSLSLSKLHTHRNRFPAWKDADDFEIRNDEEKS